MKHTYLLTAMVLASMMLAGCDSNDCNDDEFKADCSGGQISKCVDGKWKKVSCDNEFSCNAENYCGDCKNDEVNAECNDGKYSTCVDGKWTETECDGGFSCNAEKQCGECKDGDERDCNEGKVSRCVNGEYQEVECENGASCTTDNKCGECKDGEYTQCVNGLMSVGKAIACKNGKWDSEPSYCPGQFSCTMSNDCYQCLGLCEKNPCPDNCTDAECEEICNLYADCKAKCNNKYGGCESKCGECKNGEQKNCIEKDGVGSADVCINGMWALQYDCADIYGIAGLKEISCRKRCDIYNPEDGITTLCREEEYTWVCGECKNSNDLICVEKIDPIYGYFYSEKGFTDEYQLLKCVGGVLSHDPNDGAKPCLENCKNEDAFKACEQN